MPAFTPDFSPGRPGCRRRPDGRPAKRVALLVLGAALSGALATTAPAAPATAASPARAASTVETPPAFRVSSFNVLGHRHTEPGGKHAKMQSGHKRIARAMRILDRRKVEVAGLQEFQPPQYDTFRRVVGDTWAAFPGDEHGNYAMHNSIIWKTSTWELVDKQVIEIPYFRGQRVKMPYIQLRHRATDRLVWFANFHNPADSKRRGSQRAWRSVAKDLQVQLANQLWATKVPLILTGDMNEKASYFCTMAAQAPMRSASGGRVTRRGKCILPKERVRIDWIFGSRDATLDNYRVSKNRNIRRISDHPLLQADVQLRVTPRS